MTLMKFNILLLFLVNLEHISCNIFDISSFIFFSIYFVEDQVKKKNSSFLLKSLTFVNEI